MLVLVRHPLVQHKLSLMRDKRTGVKEFRELASEMAVLLAYEATRDLELEDIGLETPLESGFFPTLAGKKLALVAILRAGLVLAEALVNLIPAAKVGHIGLYRDPDSLEPVEYYAKLPQDIGERRVFLLDPMLATGGSVLKSISILKGAGAQAISLICILASPQGVELINRAAPDVEIVTASVDRGLDQHGYIVPGLGDAGDRLFGTR
jgi:uracil phosphoribosyltransferase